jgi:uncharacterized protein
MNKRFLCIALLLPLLAHSQVQIPELWGTRIHDEAKILSSSTVSQLELALKAHEDSTSNQIAILIIPTLQGQPIEDFTFRVAEQWKLGQGDKDNGVLRLIAVEDRQMRIEVGEGLEGVLPDAICNQIIRNEMAPHFRQNDYDGGVRAGVIAIIQAIGGEYQAEKTPARRGGKGGSLWGTLIIMLIILLINWIRGGGRGGNMRRRGWSGGAGWYGGGFSGGGSGGFGGGGFSGGGGGFSGGGSSGSW